MAGGDAIDIVAPHALKVQHDRCQLVVIQFAALAQMADIIILAESAPQVAVGEKNGARSLATHQGRLFAEMGIIGGYHGQSAGVTGSGLPVRSVHATATRAQGAAGQRVESLIDPSLESSGF
jgi:hypothetical protein